MVDVVDGKVAVKPGSGVTVEEVETQMAITRNQVRSLSQICNGSLNEENRTAASRNWIARFMTAHRGWLVLAAQRLWKDVASISDNARRGRVVNYVKEYDSQNI